ncbi:ABC transporter ATP-binding protein [Primorskyibacter sedentarius]|uniref:ABC transporter ATP-binding protein n=1 Tax=Primorskyibacter sedentarius TaxID=745311 RepID=UPI003EBAC19E
MANLKLHNINKYYGAYHAVRDVSFDIPAGEFVVLVGASGCGKSTLLRAIAGLEEISGGDMTLRGTSITRLAPRDRNVAMVFQSYALYPYLSVRENIAFGLRARKTPDAEIDTQVAWAAEVLDITDYLDRYPRELSGGQRQRVAIGRAIVRDADLYLFDEPLSNLDAKLRDGMREEIKKLHEKLGKTFIYVTHDQIEAMTLAQRIILLKDGQIEQVGPPLDLFERPRNAYVAAFLGSPPMNFIEVNVSAGSVILPDGQALPGCAMPDGIYTWGIRPEHFTADEQGPLLAKLDVIQPTGARSYGTFYIAGNHMMAELDAHAANHGQTRLSVAMDRTLFFDPATGEAIS